MLQQNKLECFEFLSIVNQFLRFRLGLLGFQLIAPQQLELALGKRLKIMKNCASNKHSSLFLSLRLRRRKKFVTSIPDCPNDADVNDASDDDVNDEDRRTNRQRRCRHFQGVVHFKPTGMIHF
jgi:hypothetical protein